MYLLKLVCIQLLLLVLVVHRVDSTSILDIALHKLDKLKEKLIDKHFKPTKKYWEEGKENGSCSARMNDRVIGGKEAKRGSIPWQVSIQNIHRNHFCGGAILDNNWIITAAHCVYKVAKHPSSLLIVAGEHDLDITEGTEQVVSADEIHVHEGFKKETHENDIALIKLARPLVLDGFTGHICLPEEYQESDDRRCTVSGWGATRDKSNKVSTVLREVQVPVVSHRKCLKSYENIVSIESYMLCAGEEHGGKDSCQGDSGGPLVCLSDDGHMYLAGIVSFGNGCARANYFGIYTEVTAFIHWIKYFYKPNVLYVSNRDIQVGHSTDKPEQDLLTTSTTTTPDNNARFPWVVSIQTVRRYHFCGGAIIDHQWVVTAAHCLYHAVDDPSEVVIVVGEDDLRVKGVDEQVIAAEKIIIHEYFNLNTHENDIALVRLVKPLKFNSNVKHICLPEESQTSTGYCVLSGWGSTNEGGQFVSSTMSSAAMNVVPFSTCYMDYLSVITVRKYMVCAKQDDVQSDCQGDSGAPLVCETENGHPYLSGIAAFDDGCSKSQEYHGVYTSVLSFLSWIQDNTEIHTNTDTYPCEENLRRLQQNSQGGQTHVDQRNNSDVVIEGRVDVLCCNVVDDPQCLECRIEPRCCGGANVLPNSYTCILFALTIVLRILWQNNA